MTGDYGAARPRGRTATAAAVVFLLVLAGALVGRFTAPDPDEPGASAPVAAGPGPSSSAGGMPVGYAHTEAGAVTAATTILSALAGRTMLDPATRGPALDAISAPGARSDVESALRIDAAGAAAADLTGALRDGSLVARTIPAGSRLVSYGGDEASVEVWTVSLLGTRTLGKVTTGWSTTTIGLRWSGDWKFATVTARSGPVPSPGTATASRYDDFLAALASLSGYRYAPAT